MQQAIAPPPPPPAMLSTPETAREDFLRQGFVVLLEGQEENWGLKLSDECTF